MMTYVLEFSVTGLAGRDGTYHQRLNKNVNVFFGLNGSGKTSLFKIIHSALTNDASILKDVPFSHAEVKIYSDKYERNFTYTIKKTPDTQDPLNIDLGSLELELPGIEDTIKRHFQTNSNANWSVRPKLPSDFRGAWHHRYLPTSRLYLGATAFYTGGTKSLSQNSGEGWHTICTGVR